MVMYPSSILNAAKSDQLPGAPALIFEVDLQEHHVFWEDCQVKLR